MPIIADVYRSLNSLGEEKVVEKYAVCGGTAALFYDTETLRTYDLDVFVTLPRTSFLLDLNVIYAWARARGFGANAEHLMIHNVPVQVLAAGAGSKCRPSSMNSKGFDTPHSPGRTKEV